MDMFSRLPEDVVSHILGRTSVRDVCTVAGASKALCSAANSDLVWDKFLPSDCFQILQRSDSQVLFGPRKELFRRLCCDADVLIDSGKLCFSLETKYGHKVYMVSARGLTISWGDNSSYWEWISGSDLSSSLPEVAKLVFVCWLDIRGKINRQMLSTNTNYGVFLVFRLDEEEAYGLESVKAVLRLVNEEDDSDAENRADLLNLQAKSFFGGPQHGRTSNPRYVRDVHPDEWEWEEIEMGSFYNGEGDSGELEARLMEIRTLGPKSGLIIEGIEFRPIYPI